MGQLRTLTGSILWAILLMVLVLPIFAKEASSGVVSEDQLMRLWDNAKTDSLLLVFRPFVASHPSDAVTLFIQAALEKDGRKAAGGYHDVVAEGGDSPAVPRAMLRLEQYYHSTGDLQEAYQWEQRLKMDYPYFQPPQYQPEMERESDYPFTLQLGAFGVLENAQKFSQQVEEYGLSSQIRQKIVNGRELYLVWAGQFGSETEAEKVGQRLHREKKLNYRIIAISREE
jgi:hypothetical protein